MIMFGPTGPEIDELGIYYVDGIPCAYMEIQGDNGDVIRLKYIAICYDGSDEEKVENRFKLTLKTIKEELLRAAKENDSFPIVFWRERPRREGTLWYCRLATSPKLQPSFWGNFDKKEGELPRRVG
jgi:hypothetical protein